MRHSCRYDTRRKRHGKMIGGHNGNGWPTRGYWHKTRYWRSERQYWKQYARLSTQYDESYDREIVINPKTCAIRHGNMFDYWL